MPGLEGKALQFLISAGVLCASTALPKKASLWNRSLCFCQGAWGRAALEGKGPQRRPQKPLHGRLEEVAEAAGGGSCRLSMPLRLAVWETVAGHRLGTLVSGEGGAPPLSNASLGGSRSCATTGQSCSSPCAKLFVNAKAKPIPIV